MEEANRQHQMEIQSRGRLDTIDTIIPLKKKQEKVEERGRQVAAQSNTVEATNTESTSRDPHEHGFGVTGS